MTKKTHPLAKILQTALDIGVCVASIEFIGQLDFGVEVDERVKKEFEQLQKESEQKRLSPSKLL